MNGAVVRTLRQCPPVRLGCIARLLAGEKGVAHAHEPVCGLGALGAGGRGVLAQLDQVQGVVGLQVAFGERLGDLGDRARFPQRDLERRDCTLHVPQLLGAHARDVDAERGAVADGLLVGGAVGVAMGGEARFEHANDVLGTSVLLVEPDEVSRGRRVTRIELEHPLEVLARALGVAQRVLVDLREMGVQRERARGVAAGGELAFHGPGGIARAIRLLVAIGQGPPDVGARGRQLGEPLQVYDLAGFVAQALSAERGEPIAQRGLVGVWTLDRVLEMDAQRIPIALAGEDALEVLRRFAPDVGVPRARGELLVGVARRARLLEGLFEQQGSLEDGPVAQGRVGRVLDLAREELGEARRVDAVAQRPLEAGRGLRRLGRVLEYGAVESRRLVGTLEDVHEQVRAAQHELDGVGAVRVVALGAAAQALCQIFVSLGAFEQIVDAALGALRRVVFGLELFEGRDGDREIAPCLVEIGDLDEGGRPLPRAAQLEQALEHRDPLFQGVGLTEQRCEALEGLDVTGLDVEGAAVGADRFGQLVSRLEQGCDLAPVAALLLVVEQRVERFERGRELDLLAGAIVDARQGAKRFRLLRARRGPALDPRECGFGCSVLLVQVDDLTHELAEPSPILDAAGLALEGDETSPLGFGRIECGRGRRRRWLRVPLGVELRAQALDGGRERRIVRGVGERPGVRVESGFRIEQPFFVNHGELGQHAGAHAGVVRGECHAALEHVGQSGQALEGGQHLRQCIQYEDVLRRSRRGALQVGESARVLPSRGPQRGGLEQLRGRGGIPPQLDQTFERDEQRGVVPPDSLQLDELFENLHPVGRAFEGLAKPGAGGARALKARSLEPTVRQRELGAGRGVRLRPEASRVQVRQAGPVLGLGRQGRETVEGQWLGRVTGEGATKQQLRTIALRQRTGEQARLLGERPCARVPHRSLRGELRPGLCRVSRSAGAFEFTRGVFEGCARIQLAHVRWRTSSVVWA
jgi:hypothetical protein